MTKEDLKELVKQHFNLTEVSENNSEELVEENFAEAMLEDGTKVKSDKPGDFTVGDKLMVIREDGIEAPAPEGEHVTKSGIQLIVDSEGMIAGVKYPDQEGEGSADLAEHKDEEDMEKKEEEMSTEEMSAETEEASDESEEKFEDKEEEKMEEMPKLEEIIEVIGEVIEEKMKIYDEKMMEIKDEVMGIKEKMNSFASEPAEEKTVPVAMSKNTVKEGFATAKAEKTYNQLLNKLKLNNKLN